MHPQHRDQHQGQQDRQRDLVGPRVRVLESVLLHRFLISGSGELFCVLKRTRTVQGLSWVLSGCRRCCPGARSRRCCCPARGCS
ncbi:hypothetical protein [Ornithinimicrobium kibberense]|uniref:hypothetical protein n=1 Tax=Ornithinimicrobium kibberense TaxID=282060 RepID=UPI0036243EAC